MPEFALTLNLKDDPRIVEAYKKYHAEVWPEVAEALKEVGVTDMKIWLLGRRLFMVYQAKEGFVPEIDFPKYLKIHPLCQQWEDLMGTFQEPVAEAQPNEKWAAMELIFNLNRF